MNNPQPVAILTAGGRGISEAAVKQFAESVHAVDVNEADAARVGEEVVDASCMARSAVLDVRSADGCKSVVEIATSTWGRVDALFNNAGIFDDARIFNMAEEQRDAAVDISLKGSSWDPVRCSRS